MRLFLYADSKNKIGYIPEWLKIRYEFNETKFELTFDIDAHIDSDQELLHCVCSGKLVPWILRNCETGNETVFYERDNKKLDNYFVKNGTVELIDIADSFEIGIYPINYNTISGDLLNSDVLTNCEGSIEINNKNGNFIRAFNFTTKII